MKSIIISINPKWCELIASGKKTKDERKTAPKEVPFKVLMYCTKEKNKNDIIWAGAFGDRGKWNGKVIGEFICNKVDKLWGADAETEKQTCLSLGELFAYANDKPIYGLHITDLKIYDKPKELSEFRKPCGNCIGKCTGEHYERCPWQTVIRPPQSWMYVEEEV